MSNTSKDVSNGLARFTLISLVAVILGVFVVLRISVALAGY